MCFLWKDSGIGFPEVAERMSVPILFRDQIPKFLTRLQTVIAVDKGDDLPGAAAKGRPQPNLMRTLVDKTPDFVKFQDFLRLGRLQSRTHRRQIQELFFNQSVIVPLAIPKVRATPRKLERS